MRVSEDVVAVLRAKFEAVLPHLDERGQRLVMAAEARSLGHGGIAAVHRATGASKTRITAGVAELESGRSLWSVCAGPAPGARSSPIPTRAWCQRCWVWWSPPGGEIRSRRC